MGQSPKRMSYNQRKESVLLQYRGNAQQHPAESVSMGQRRNEPLWNECWQHLLMLK
jgi:hypothetical protein